MYQEQEHIFEQALQMLAKGESFEDTLKAFPEYPSLAEDLDVVTKLQTIPIATPPAPTMRYKFTQKQSASQKIFALFGNYKFAAVPLAIAVIIGGSYSIMQAAEHSLPGEKLYGVKIASEQARLQFTFDENKEAALHVALAKKRLEEARTVITLNNPSQEVAALDALEKQTAKTFEVTSQLAATNAFSDNDQSLLDNLVAINKEKKSVLQDAANSSVAKEVAETALSNSKETDMDLAKLIAAVNEQSLLDLPNKISVTGIITSFGKNTVTVEKNQFTFNDETVVLSQDGEPITNFVTLSGQIAIIGSRNNNSLIAKKIVVIDPDAVTPPEPVPTTTAARAPVATTPAPTESSPVEPTAVQQPNEATAGFIVEPSTQQYTE